MGANLRDADLRKANLRDAKLRNANLVHAKLQDADLWNANVRKANLQKAKLGSANLLNARLDNADLRRAWLGGANLRNAGLEGANLWGAKLEGADLRKAKLWGATLVHADLRSANLRDASLRGAYLANANLENAKLSATLFHALDLREVKGLDKANHWGPSPLSSQTLVESQGQIPDVFLKGCGLEDWEILSAKLHEPNLRPDEAIDIAYEIGMIRAESPIVPLSVFISYTRDDESFVEKVEKHFDQDGIRCWRDVHDMVAGPVEAQVDRAIGLQRVTLLVLSEKSVNSRWVEAEAEKALDAEKELNKDPKKERRYLLCPVALDSTWEKCNWPGWLRSQIKKVNILDFSRWGSDKEFETQYEKLKTGLGIYYADKGES